MPSPVAHFAINAGDVSRARQFYENVFGWKFNAWGPPGFFQIDFGIASPPALIGALQQRRELIPGQTANGFECTISVEDVEATAKAIAENGGRVVMEPVAIPTVGRVLFFEDSEGNVAGAIQFDQG